jgi:hypothetical protein
LLELQIYSPCHTGRPLHAAWISGIFPLIQTIGTKFPPRRFHMGTPRSPQCIDGSQSKDVDEMDAHLLEQTVEKLVRYRQRVGVTPEDMISLLDSGMSIRDLLSFCSASVGNGESVRPLR